MIPDETRVDGPRGDYPVHPPHGGRSRASKHQLTAAPWADAGERARNGDPGSPGREPRLADAVATGQSAGDELADELHAFERLRQGLSPLRRSWLSVREIREAVDQTVRPWTFPRRVRLVWDGGDDPTWQTYADPHLLRRLLVNLLSDAVRDAASGDAVLVHVRKVRRDEAIRWSVVERGVATARQRIGSPGQPGPFSVGKGLVSVGGDAAGLSSACRLADLNFATLNVGPRFGFGTEVWFETPSGGPRAVASCWTRWRDGWAVSLPSPHRTGPHFSRPDPRASGRGPESPRRLMAGVVSVGGTVPQAAADRFDEVFQDRLGRFDFAYRTSPRTWVWFCDADAGGYRARIRQIEDAIERESGRIRLRWGQPQRICVDGRGFRTRVTDWLIRHQLSATFRVGVDVTGLRVAVGRHGAPRTSASSAVMAARLDREIRRLRGRGRHRVGS